MPFLGIAVCFSGTELSLLVFPCWWTGTILSHPLIQEGQLSVTVEALVIQEGQLSVIGEVLINCLGNFPDRLTDRTRNDMKSVEGP